MSTSNDRSYEYDDNGQVQFVSINIFGSADQSVRTDRDKFQRRKLKRDIESGLIDPNSVNADGGPLWHFICQRLDDDDVDWATSLFCRDPVQIDARDNFGRTALHLAVYNDLERMTELLLSEGANPNLVNDGGETPLHVICRIDKYQPAEASRNNGNVRVNARRAQNKQRRFVERQERIIESLLERGADPNARDANGFTPLHVVCQKKCDDDYVRSLTVTIRNDPWSLNLATYRNYRSVIETMLRRGADPTVANAEGSTPLHLICKGFGDNHQLAETLFERYRPIPIDARDAKGETPLHLALRESNRLLVQWLLRKGVDRNLANSKGETPLHVVCQRRKDDVGLARWIMSIRSDDDDDDDRHPRVQIDARDNSNDAPLHFAARQGHLSLMSFLLQEGADPTLVNDNGETPLHLICRKKCEDDLRNSRGLPWSLNLAPDRNYQSVIELMLRRDANPTLADAKGSTPLHIICQGYGDDHQLAETLFERYRPIPIDARDANGETALHLALRENNEGLVFWLLGKGADRNLANSKGETPLHVVCQRQRDFDAVNLARWIMTVTSEYDDRRPLVQIDARDNSNDAPLHLATSHGHLSLMSFLLKNGANPTLVNDKGETPLHNICRKGSDRCWPLLLFRICDERQLRVQVDARDTLGRTPLQWAVASFNLYLIDVLLDRGADLFSFVFPVERHFYERFRTNVEGQFESKVELASGIMMALEHLESKGWELELSDALTIMNFFANHGLFEESPAIEECLNNKEFVGLVKRIKMIKTNLSLYNLIQLRPKEAAKQLTYKDYFELVRSKGLGRTFAVYSDCFAHLCEKLSRKFFLDWAIESFCVLIHCRLPTLCCYMILENLNNEDLYHICLAAAGQTVKDGKICAIKRIKKRPVRARKAPKRLQIEW